MKIIAVSGGFDPVHIGHIELFENARQLGDHLVVLLNNDNWLQKKKGFVFMNERERKAVLEAMRNVDEVIITSHPQDPVDMSVSAELEQLKPNVFANGGDRNEKDAADPNSPLYKDIQTCKRLGIEIVFNMGKGGKLQSSSDLVKRVKGIP